LKGRPGELSDIAEISLLRMRERCGFAAIDMFALNADAINNH
jgi:hypothetical protein